MTQTQAALGSIKSELVFKNIHFLDVFTNEFKKGDVAIHQGQIVGILDEYQGENEVDGKDLFLVPGFIDTHVHIESSMMIPSTFSNMVLPLGTTTAIWDPHEVANVWGKKGIDWAISSSENLPLDLFIMLPSCVPSTSPELGFETSGAHLIASDLLPYVDLPRVLGLAEMMNYPGVIYENKEVLDKIELLKNNQKKIDGHAPSLRHKELSAYILNGMDTCHESIDLEEASEKLSKGMHVLIREGSCAKNAKVLSALLDSSSSSELAFCSDDRNSSDIFESGHLDGILRIALKEGKRAEDVFRAVSYGASKIYRLHDRGSISPGKLADLVLIKKTTHDWKDGFLIEAVYKKGKKIEKQKFEETKNNANEKNLKIKPYDDTVFKVFSSKPTSMIRVIEVIPNQIVTHHLNLVMKQEKGEIKQDLEKDILKIAVIERHKASGSKSVGFVKGFGLKNGAIATSVNHDSHNIMVIGSSDEFMLKALKELELIDGGFVVVSDTKSHSLPLPIAGLMSSKDPAWISEQIHILRALTKELGCTLEEPFIQLSFLALPVIPSLKITDQGLIDVEQFKKTELFI